MPGGHHVAAHTAHTTAKPPHYGAYPARGPFYPNASKIRAHGDELRAVLGRCVWTEAAAASKLEHLYVSRTLDNYGSLDATPAGSAPGGKAAMRVRECTVEDPSEPGAFWSVQRVGPMVSTGGDMTYFLSWDDPGHLRAQIPEGGALYLTGYAARTLTADGEQVPYPPIHLHHAHLNPDINCYSWLTGFLVKSVVRAALASFMLNPWAPIASLLAISHAIADSRIDQMHGDAQCPEALGGLDCMVHRVDNGWGTPLHRSFYTDTMVQDVRAANSPPMELWYESTMRISRRIQKPISRFFRKSAASEAATRDKYGFLPDPYVTYRVPTDTHSYFAGGDWVAPDREWIIVANHMHRRACEEHWMILGSFEQISNVPLGLPQDDFHGMHHPVPLGGAGQPTADSIKATLRASIARKRAEGHDIVVCVDLGPQVETLEPSAAQRELGVRAGEYDRYSGMYCDREGVHTPNVKDAWATQVLFHKPPLGYAPSHFPMHGILFVQAAGTPEDGNKGSDGSDGRPVERPAVVAEASLLSYEEVTTLALQSAAILVATLTLLCWFGCGQLRACRQRRRAQAGRVQISAQEMEIAEIAEIGLRTVAEQGIKQAKQRTPRSISRTRARRYATQADEDEEDFDAALSLSDTELQAQGGPA